MSKQTNNEKEKLQELAKLVRKVVRKSLKDNTLDWTVQFTMSNLEPDVVKYAAQISSPAKGVQPITYVFSSFTDLKNALVESENEIDKDKVELAFHQSRINTYKSKIEAHQARVKQIEAGETEDDEIEMEEV